MLLMLVLLIVCVLLAVSSPLVVGTALPLNPQAVIFNQLESIHHDEHSRQVIIHLTKNRTCIQPTFIVRLSGTSLYLADFVNSNHTAFQSIAFSYPPLLDVGTYFLEVVHLYCETLNPNSFASMCLVDPDGGKNVVTSPYSFNISTTERDAPRRSRWVLSRDASPVLLPTRYQKVCGAWGCKSTENDLMQYNQYEWTDKLPFEHLVRSAYPWVDSNLTPITRTGNETISICMVGASHAFSLARHGSDLNITHVSFRHISSAYPSQFDVLDLENCSYAVIGYGQWPLSHWMRGNPYSGPQYEAGMRDVLRVITASRLRTQVFMRSMNLNGLGFRQNKCPALDSRHPPIVMLFNQISSRLSAEFNVPYIDLFPIQGPHWDGALDYSHPSDKVMNAEVEFILHSVLSYSHRHKLFPALDSRAHEPVTIQRAPALVHFTNNPDTVYVLKRGEVRPYPNPSTIDRLAVHRDNIPLVDANAHADYTFGPVLPEV